MARDSWLPALWGGQRSDLDPFVTLKSQMDELFRDWTGDFERLTGAGGMTSLRVDVAETPKEITVKADLPGVEQKDIDVAVSGDRLTIKAEKKSEAETKKDEKGLVFHRIERSYGSYQRTMRLPFDIDPAKVVASFKDGVLTLTLPKPAEVQSQTKKIEIKQAA